MSRGIVGNWRLQLAGLVIAGSASIGSAWAAGSGFYFGVNAGRAQFDATVNDLAGPVAPANLFLPRPGDTLFIPTAGFVPTGVTLVGRPALIADTRFDRRDTSWSAEVGYTLNRYLSFELAYADLGEVTASSTFSSAMSDTVQFRTSQEISVDTISLAALATLPLSERWSLFARGGYAFSGSEVTVSSSFPIFAATSRARMDFDSEDFIVGAGVGFDFSSRWSLRVDYERIFDAGSNAFGSELDIDRIGLSAIYRLRSR